MEDAELGQSFTTKFDESQAIDVIVLGRPMLSRRSRSADNNDTKDIQILTHSLWTGPHLQSDSISRPKYNYVW